MSDLISREAARNALLNKGQHSKRYKLGETWELNLIEIEEALEELPSVEPERKPGKCKGCKYFEYDSMAKVDGIPLIVAHEICKRWGDGCKTSEDGYCFLYEPQEREDNTNDT